MPPCSRSDPVFEEAVRLERDYREQPSCDNRSPVNAELDTGLARAKSNPVPPKPLSGGGHWSGGASYAPGCSSTCSSSQATITDVSTRITDASSAVIRRPNNARPRCRHTSVCGSEPCSPPLAPPRPNLATRKIPGDAAAGEQPRRLADRRRDTGRALARQYRVFRFHGKNLTSCFLTCRPLLPTLERSRIICHAPAPFMNWPCLALGPAIGRSRSERASGMVSSSSVALGVKKK